MSLERQGFSAHINVVIGSAVANVKDIVRFCKTSALSTSVHNNVQNMAEIWFASRLAISAAGGSQFELAVCATPSILVAVADNQKQAGENALAEGWCELVPHDHEPTDTAQIIVEHALKLWFDPMRLDLMHHNVLNKYDALGASRVVHELAKNAA